VSPATETLGVAVGAFVDELARSGLRHVCVCPGSRSTPLAITLAEQAGITVWMHLDERSAAYFGLGLACALGEPVGLLATSGTAAANFLPAVVEASLARVGLVVLTADRPHELRGVGAPQTIDQLRLYGEHAKWFFDLPEPELTPEHVRLVRVVAARAVATATAEPAGPVHLNWPLREPLLPAPAPHEPLLPPAPAAREPLVSAPAASRIAPVAWGARPDAAPYVRVHAGRLAPSAALVSGLARELAASPRGVIVCGPQADPLLAPAVAGLAERFGYPILADPLSGVRFGGHDRSLVVDAYDAFLRDAATLERLEPQVVLRFGALPTSKPVQQYLQRYPSARQVLIDPGGWRDPTGLVSDVLHVDPRLLCEALVAHSAWQPFSREWTRRWQQVNAVARAAVEAHLVGADELFEGKIFASLLPLLPGNATVYAGNSMPVRDLDTFSATTGQPLRCLSNRGANGIDGVVSSALGASAAGCGPVVLVIGDVSFYHDLNGLLAARKHGLDLLVVLINNDGGGIFSFLPQAELPLERFEALFGTPHGLDFRPFVEGYGGQFRRVEDWSSFASAVADALARGGLQVVELPTRRDRNVELHRQVWRVVAEALAPVTSPVA
jgi:2-succinyl-5-enolpyruvyl-6-hydroxy-3-cyclohexene-1-carboxylate synthase